MNNLVNWLKSQQGNQSIRQLALNLEVSHSYLAKILKEELPISWNFAATVAEKMGLDYMTAFEMAGLLQKNNGDNGAGAAPSSPLEKVTKPMVTQNNGLVTKGEC